MRPPVILLTSIALALCAGGASAETVDLNRGAFGCGLYPLSGGKVAPGQRPQHLSFVLPARLGENIQPASITMFDPTDMFEGKGFAEVTSDKPDEYFFSAGQPNGLMTITLLIKKASRQPSNGEVVYDARLMNFGPEHPGTLKPVKDFKGLCFYTEDRADVLAYEAEQRR